MRRDLVSLALALCLPRSRSLLWLEAEGRRLHGGVTRRVTYFLRGRPGWYLEETAWRRKAGHLHVEAESPSEDARCGLVHTELHVLVHTELHVLVHHLKERPKDVFAQDDAKDRCWVTTATAAAAGARRPLPKRRLAESVEGGVHTCGAGAVQAHTAAE